MWERLSRSCLLVFLFFSTNCATLVAQVKTYLTAGASSYTYSTKSEALTTNGNSYFAGVTVDKYVSYHYAISGGATFLRGGYDNGISKWDNRFIRVPLYLKAAPLGETLDLFAGLDFNILMKSTLKELADTLSNYVTTDVTSAFQRVQPDFTFGIAYRLKRITLGMKYSLSLTNRYSTKVKGITDRNQVYYASWYAYSLAKDEHKLKSTVIQVYLSARLF